MPGNLDQIEIFDALPDALVVADDEGRMVFLNSAAEALFGYSASECAGQPIEMLLPERYGSRHVTDRTRYSLDPVPRPMAKGRDLSARHRDGHEIAVDVSLTSLRGEAGTRIIATVHDISERRRNEQALRASELKYRRLAENASDIVVRRRLISPPGIDYISPSAERILGYRPDEFYADPDLILKIADPRDVHLFEEFRRAPESLPTRLIARMIAKGGDLKWIEFRSTLIRDETGVAVAVEAIARDVTTAKINEDVLRQSEERYRLLADNAQDVVYRASSGTTPRLDYISPSVSHMLGFDPEELYADASIITTLVHPDDQSMLQAVLASSDLFVEPLVVRSLTKSGEMRWIEHRGTAVYDEQGNLASLDGIARDVTSTKRAEEALRGSEGRLRAAIENLPFFVWAYDSDARCYLQNTACKEQWGDHTGQLQQDMPCEATVSTSWRETLDRGLRGEIVHREDQFDSDSEHRLFRSTAAPIWSGTSITGVLVVNIDVTEQRRAHTLELELRASHESERLKDTLLSTVSHELRTPISVIRGYATLAVDFGDKLTTEEVRQYLRDIDRHAVELERLVNDLLIMSRLEAGVLPMDLQSIDIAGLIGGVVGALEVAHAGRRVNVSIQPATMRTVADPDRIGQVLYNLLDNAGKYSDPDAAIEVSVTEREGGVALSVRDHGPGVAPTELDAIFGRFYQAPGRPRVTGAGLGLAICRSIVEAQGATIEATLPSDGGLEVTISLPAVPPTPR